MIKLRMMCGISLVALSVTFFNSAAYADPGQGKGYGKGHQKVHGKGHVQGHKKGKVKHAGKAKGIGHSAAKTNAKHFKNVTFTKVNKTTIANYYKATPFKTGTLPPGIAMNLARGKPLPPGIQKVFLPQNLVTTLPVHPGYEYLAVGPNVVLVNSTTGVVADILANVLK